MLKLTIFRDVVVVEEYVPIDDVPALRITRSRERTSIVPDSLATGVVYLDPESVAKLLPYLITWLAENAPHLAIQTGMDLVTHAPDLIVRSGTFPRPPTLLNGWHVNGNVKVCPDCLREQSQVKGTNGVLWDVVCALCGQAAVSQWLRAYPNNEEGGEA